MPPTGLGVPTSKYHAHPASRSRITYKKPHFKHSGGESQGLKGWRLPHSAALRSPLRYVRSNKRGGVRHAESKDRIPHAWQFASFTRKLQAYNKIRFAATGVLGSTSLGILRKGVLRIRQAQYACWHPKDGCLHIWLKIHELRKMLAGCNGIIRSIEILKYPAIIWTSRA